MNRHEIASGLAHFIVAAFWLTAAGIAALAVALAAGLANPRPPGRFLWEDDFSDLSRWQIAGQRMEATATQSAPAGLALMADGEGGWQAALVEAPEGDYAVEVAAAQTGGDESVRHGLVLGWRDVEHYTAVLISRDGYAEVFTQAGEERTVRFVWQPWPHILLGGEPNRLRADVRGGRVEVRINDERLVEFEAEARGRFGPWVVADRTGVVLFYWAKAWGGDG